MENKKVEMSFRSKPGTTSPKPEASFGDLAEGQKADGVVKKVEEFGVFITLKGTKVTGLCHKSEVYIMIVSSVRVTHCPQDCRQQGCGRHLGSTKL